MRELPVSRREMGRPARRTPVSNVHEGVSMEPMFRELGISLLLGMLVGLQREHAAHGHGRHENLPVNQRPGHGFGPAGGEFGGWTLAAGFVGVAAVVLIGHLTRLQPPQPTPGTTTDMAMLLMFAVGALVGDGADGNEGGHRRRRRRRRAPAIQARTAQFRPAAGRRRPQGDHAVRVDHLHHPAGAAQSTRSVGRKRRPTTP